MPLSERTARWRSRWFGPDERERRASLPRSVVIGLFVAIAALALALRVSQLVDLPAGFFCDEAGNGYNAYSLLHSGRDETGARWPLYVWSFGVSYKNPVFIYSAMLPMALLGATELAVRLTAALYGFGAVVAMFFLGRALMGNVVGLIAALLLAVCPWHLHFSRIGFELIALPFFFTLALTSLVRWTQGRRTLPQAMVLFGLCFYTYVPAKLIVPLFLVGFAALYARPLLARWRESVLAAALLIVTIAPATIFDLRHREEAGSYFRNTTLLALDEPPLELVRTFLANYTEFFSRQFLFVASNDKIVRHTVAEHGQLYAFFAPLLIVGAAVALLRRDRAMRLPLLWLALYPLAPALMNEIPSARAASPERPHSACSPRSAPADSCAWRRRSASAAASCWRCRARSCSPVSPCSCRRCATTGCSTATTTGSTPPRSTPAFSSDTGRWSTTFASTTTSTTSCC